MIKEEFKHQEEVEERQPWIYTYGDLFTLLVAFFVIISTQNQNPPPVEKVTTPTFRGGPPASPYFFKGSPLVIDNQYNVIEAIAERNDEVDITLDDRGLVVSLNSNIAFAPASAILSNDAKEVITNFAKLIYTIPNSIVIEGHSDDIPINTAEFPSNWALSSARAARVALEFERLGIDPKRLEVVGLAATRPKVRNVDAIARAINRRTEILIRPY